MTRLEFARLVALTGSLALAACGEPKTEAKAPPPPEVGVLTLRPQEASVSTVLPGRVTAYQVSEVRPQVGGILLKRDFVEGAEVKEGDGCSMQPPPYVVAARGVEPFWSAEIREKEITWRQTEAPTEILMQIPAAADAEGTVSYRGVAEGYELEMEIEGQPCRDAASGEYFAYSALASLNGKEFNGCARVGS